TEKHFLGLHPNIPRANGSTIAANVPVFDKIGTVADSSVKPPEAANNTWGTNLHPVYHLSDVRVPIRIPANSSATSPSAFCTASEQPRRDAVGVSYIHQEDCRRVLIVLVFVGAAAFVAVVVAVVIASVVLAVAPRL